MLRAPPHHRHLLEVAGGGVISSSPPPVTGSQPHEGGMYGSSEASFDTNMVIILAALLCALICALGLNSIVRCALRCTGQFLPGSAQDPTNQPQASGARVAVGCRGLKRSTLRQIPVAIYEKNPSNNNQNANNNNNNNNSSNNYVMISTDCIICLGEFIEGEKIRVLPKCKHGFHVRCIDVWLLSHSSCPTCRQPVVAEWAEMGGGSGGGNNGSAINNTQRQGPSEVVVTIVG